MTLYWEFFFCERTEAKSGIKRTVSLSHQPFSLLVDLQLVLCHRFQQQTHPRCTLPSVTFSNERLFHANNRLTRDVCAACFAYHKQPNSLYSRPSSCLCICMTVIAVCWGDIMVCPPQQRLQVMLWASFSLSGNNKEINVHQGAPRHFLVRLKLL